VAEIAQSFERREQSVIVALMQADRRLVENIEHAGEAGADLRSEADALALAARQRAGGARHGQVFETDIAQEAEPLVDLFEDALRDIALLGGERLRQCSEPFAGFEDREIADLADIELVD